MGLSIIIVNFNTKEVLRKCLASIEKLETGNKQSLLLRNWKLETIVVDNGSTDGSVEAIEARYKDIKILRNKENLGFAKAVNQGIKQATGEYILLLNPDTEVKPNVLEELIKFVQNHPKAGVVGARLLNPDGSIQPSVYHFPTIWRAIREFWLGRKGEYDKYAPLEKKTIDVEAVTGAAMLIPRKTIEKVGLLDERYFLYFEDLDYCRRIKKAGLKVYYCPSAEIIHGHGESAAQVGSQAYQWLCQSSKIYNGILKYWLLTAVLWIGQKWQKIVGKR